MCMIETEKMKDDTLQQYKIIRHGHCGVMQTIHSTLSVDRHTKRKAWLSRETEA